MEASSLLVIVMLLVMLLSLVAVAYTFLMLLRPWLRAVTSGTPVSVLTILGMRLRGNPPDLILSAYTSLVFAGDDAPLSEVESVYIANRGTIRNAQDLIDAVRADADATNQGNDTRGHLQYK